MNNYSILIPIHNEKKSIKALLSKLATYETLGHELIIIDDGSTDGGDYLLKESKIINLISIKENMGKGYAIREGIKVATNNRIVIYDGDLELETSDILKLMILDHQISTRFVVGFRFNSLNPINSGFDWGNFIFTGFFNIIFRANYKDILCCAKSFYLNDLKNYDLKSNGFDIDVELCAALNLKNHASNHVQVKLNYDRRGLKDGKKLKVSDGWKILSRVLKMIKHY